MSVATEITRKAKSNLAIALRILPKARRDDMVVFYAFCRTVDDIADDPVEPKSLRRKKLAEWEEGLREGFFPKDNELGNAVVEMIGRYGISPKWLTEIIDGCRMDLEVQSFGSWEELMKYNWKVAGVVGLVCTRIFGCVHKDSDKYAELLGNALQLTNILRDVGEDLANGGRIYLPVNDMIRFQYSERDLVGKVYDGRFLAMMSYHAQRAEYYFQEAQKMMPEIDERSLLPARIMSDIYHDLLENIRAGEFRVFDKRFRVSKFRKVAILAKYLIAGRY
ncbi:phytoene/squalene synthase family protein [Luteolibacter sp. AS25]|uniref:phytoene/squalene synthase family protein n=1 Tax=Luteolibacter sp. AS25 TaxID=3135776 RepID=UPI00398A96DF